MSEELKVYMPVKAIRKFCLECSCGQMNEVKYCTRNRCPLFPYRFGHRPKPGEDPFAIIVEPRKKQQEADDEEEY